MLAQRERSGTSSPGADVACVRQQHVCAISMCAISTCEPAVRTAAARVRNRGPERHSRRAAQRTQQCSTGTERYIGGCLGEHLSSEWPCSWGHATRNIQYNRPETTSHAQLEGHATHLASSRLFLGRPSSSNSSSSAPVYLFTPLRRSCRTEPPVQCGYQLVPDRQRPLQVLATYMLCHCQCRCRCRCRAWFRLSFCFSTSAAFSSSSSPCGPCCVRRSQAAARPLGESHSATSHRQDATGLGAAGGCR